VNDRDQYLDCAIQVAREAGTVIREGAHRTIEVRSKGLRDLLTDVDLAAERTIVATIRARYPEHDIVTEETPPGERSSPFCWIIDPLDGTGNFSRRYPCFSTSIALTRENEPIAGVVYDPLHELLFAASLEGGATLNGRALRVSEADTLLDTMIGMDWTRAPESRRQNVQVFGQLAPLCGTIRVCGSAALSICYVGAGWWDAYWHLELSPWDAAAGALIVREAGGRVTDARGERWTPVTGSCLASNGRVHDMFAREVKRAVVVEESDHGAGVEARPVS
jgi:myo-inositol-1(or 4)-monophosphatase